MIQEEKRKKRVNRTEALLSFLLFFLFDTIESTNDAIPAPVHRDVITKRTALE